MPIPMFYCKERGKELINAETIKAVSKLFRERPNKWWSLTRRIFCLKVGFAPSAAQKRVHKKKRYYGRLV